MALKKIMIILVVFVCVLSIGLCSCQTDPLTQRPITSDTETKDVLETTGDSETSRPTGSKGVIPLKYLVEEELPHSSSTEYAVMTFGPNCSGDIVFSDDLTYGNAQLTEENTIKIAYSKRTNLYVYYMAKIKFNVGDYASTSLRYVRVLYRAKNPEGTDSVSMLIENDSNGHRYMLQESVVDTNGEYVLSDTALLPLDMLDRFMTKLHNSIILNPKGNDGEYEIKAVYFFASRKSADNFSPTSGNHTITINGNDIAKYQIVIDDEATVNIVTYAQKLAAHISSICNVTIPIVTDKTATSDYEIRIGQSSRDNTRESNGVFSYYGKLIGNTYIISGGSTLSVSEGTNQFLKKLLYEGNVSIPQTITVTEKQNYSGSVTDLQKLDIWENRLNTANPIKLNLDFGRDEGYFTNEELKNAWTYQDGVYHASRGDGLVASYIHVYEQNVELKAKMKYHAADDDGIMGLTLRSTSPYAYVRAGYDFSAQAWYLETREGMDFYPQRVASKAAELREDTWYTLSVTVNGGVATLTVNGEKILTATDIQQTSPGRIGVYANNVDASVDNMDLTLLSGQGLVLKHVTHTILPDEIYREGGSVIEMKDNSLVYIHSSGTTFRSFDSGKTWERTDTWTDPQGNPNILRLVSGKLLRVSGVGGKLVAFISEDDGKTWTQMGTICKNSYNGTSAGAGNMNDKVMQSATTGRIFYTQGYEAPKTDPVNGRIVFCEFYYSDDDGKTWKKTETDPWQIRGLEGEAYVGEWKIIQCADGSLRAYCSWNNLGCMIYSESIDNGVTWGPVIKMTGFVCSRSSMQIVRDPYANNVTTYYMVWSDSKLDPATIDMSRAALTLAKSEDGKNWTILGDVWRWESNYKGALYGTHLNHMVDPFINVTKDAILVGAGISEYYPIDGAGDNIYHFAQRQHIWCIER